MTSLFTRFKDKFEAKYKFDVNQVVHEYDTFLQYSLVTTSSFQDILDDRLNRRRRALQLTNILFYWFYLIPRYSFLILLYFREEKTRQYYQHILADYAEEIGILGRTFNIAVVIFGIGTLVNAYVMRKFEGQGSLEFLTDWLKRIPKKPRIEHEVRDEITALGDLDNESRHKLMSGLHYKCNLARFMARTTGNAIRSIDLIALSIFIYKRRPSFFITCLGLWNSITVLIGSKVLIHHLYSLYLSYIVTTDYFKVVINNILRKVEDLKTKEMTNRNVTPILDDYDFMMNDFKKYNLVLKPLFGNLVYFYTFELTATFGFTITRVCSVFSTVEVA